MAYEVCSGLIERVLAVMTSKVSKPVEKLGIMGTSSVGMSVSDIHSVAIECSPNLVDPLDSPVAPIGELVVSIPPPSCDHRKHEDPALA